MNVANPFNDEAFKKEILQREGILSVSGDGSSDEYEEVPDEKVDLRSVITSKPLMPDKAAKNLILDAGMIAKNEREKKAIEIEQSLNNVLTEYNEKYGLNLNLSLSDFSKSLAQVADPKNRRILELYVSEVYGSVKSLLYLHLIQKIMLVVDYILDPSRLLSPDNNLQPADYFIIVEKLIGYVNMISDMSKEVSVKGSDLELKQLAEKNSEVDFESEDSKMAIAAFMNLFNKEHNNGK